MRLARLRRPVKSEFQALFLHCKLYTAHSAFGTQCAVRTALHCTACIALHSATAFCAPCTLQFGYCGCIRHTPLTSYFNVLLKRMQFWLLLSVFGNPPTHPGATETRAPLPKRRSTHQYSSYIVHQTKGSN